jgi:hypothetical protein
MIHVILLLCNFIFGVPILHTSHVAEFKYYTDDERIQLMLMIDLEDLDYLKNDNSCNYQQMSTLCTSKYITNNSTLYINNKPIKFNFDESFTKKNHLYIYFNSETKIKQLNSLSIHNSCFYEFNPHFKNRVILNLDTFEGTYLLTKQTTEINL